MNYDLIPVAALAGGAILFWFVHRMCCLLHDFAHWLDSPHGKRSWPQATRVLGLCGLSAAAIGTFGGMLWPRESLVAASAVMLVGNLYAVWRP